MANRSAWLCRAVSRAQSWATARSLRSTGARCPCRPRGLPSLHRGARESVLWVQLVARRDDAGGNAGALRDPPLSRTSPSRRRCFAPAAQGIMWERVSAERPRRRPRNPKYPAQPRHRVIRPLRVDELECAHRVSLAKKAAAFFKISRSSLRIRFSRRRRSRSLRSGLVTPSFLPRSTSACSTQRRTADAVRSSSRQMSGIDLPLDSISSTVRARNSGVKLRRVRRDIGASFRAT